MRRKCAVLLFILLKSTVEAGIFIKAKNAELIQDKVWLYLDATQAPLEMNVQKVYTKSIIALDHAPLALPNGTSGILYTKDNPCASIGSMIQVPAIALIENQDGNCSTIDRVLNAQLEGALGVILYDNVTADLSHKKEVLPLENNIKIPAYYAYYSTGVELYDQLIRTPSFGQNQTRIPVVRITLMPPLNVNSTAWEFTLLIMIVVLVTSLLFSALMHFYMKKKRRQLQSIVERRHLRASFLSASMKNEPITLSRLEDFPTRIIQHTSPQQLNTKSNHEKKSSIVLPPFDDWNQTLSKRSSVAIHVDDAYDNTICVICLETFKIGDKVRELPCRHEYHCACIDPWLTSKSCMCPLCKFDCTLDTRHHSTFSFSSRSQRWSCSKNATPDHMISTEAMHVHDSLPRAPAVAVFNESDTPPTPPPKTTLLLENFTEDDSLYASDLYLPNDHAPFTYTSDSESAGIQRSFSLNVQELETIPEESTNSVNQESDDPFSESDNPFSENKRHSSKSASRQTFEPCALLNEGCNSNEARLNSHHSHCEQYKLYKQYHQYEEQQLYEHFQTYEKHLESGKHDQDKDKHSLEGPKQRGQEQLLDELLLELTIQKTEANQRHSKSTVSSEQHDGKMLHSDSALTLINDAIEIATEAITEMDENVAADYDRISLFANNGSASDTTVSNVLFPTIVIQPTSNLGDSDRPSSDSNTTVIQVNIDTDSQVTTASEENNDEMYTSIDLTESDSKDIGTETSIATVEPKASESRPSSLYINSVDSHVISHAFETIKLNEEEEEEEDRSNQILPLSDGSYSSDTLNDVGFESQETICNLTAFEQVHEAETPFDHKFNRVNSETSISEELSSVDEETTKRDVVPEMNTDSIQQHQEDDSTGEVSPLEKECLLALYEGQLLSIDVSSKSSQTLNLQDMMQNL